MVSFYNLSESMNILSLQSGKDQDWSEDYIAISADYAEDNDQQEAWLQNIYNGIVFLFSEMIEKVTKINPEAGDWLTRTSDGFLPAFGNFNSIITNLNIILKNINSNFILFMSDLGYHANAVIRKILIVCRNKITQIIENTFKNAIPRFYFNRFLESKKNFFKRELNLALTEKDKTHEIFKNFSYLCNIFQLKIERFKDSPQKIVFDLEKFKSLINSGLYHLLDSFFKTGAKDILYDLQAAINNNKDNMFIFSFEHLLEKLNGHS